MRLPGLDSLLMLVQPQICIVVVVDAELEVLLGVIDAVHANEIGFADRQPAAEDLGIVNAVRCPRVWRWKYQLVLRCRSGRVRVWRSSMDLVCQILPEQSTATIVARLALS